ncbi:GAS2-like protein 2 [Astyanax mexicanus]|uniref:GAS2-like protein 2 n=1 Tax=Astyanax mexicanus TaxID=7994 RepID=A0A8T2MEN9_ASTMX|nr:GAS2-like protein 2 [Astyanax mexicanus]
MSGIEHASSQSIKPFRSSEEYLYAMKEDLAEWLKDLYRLDLTVNNLLELMETGVLLCDHANNVTRVAEDFGHKHGHTHLQLPTSGVTFVRSAQPATFLARDNVSNFINWCRNQMYIKDVLMFETDDLVLRKNEKNFVLCLLEVARRASRFGMAAPVLIQLEQEIEEEIREEMEMTAQDTPQPVVQRCLQSTQNLDEMVQHLISRCTCPTQFPMVKISEGKYRVGDSSTLIFVRILRNHVMVRVGGGWDTLEHYLDKHDPCRCTSLTHKLAQRPVTPVHEIKAMPCGPESQTGSQTTLLLTRVQSPLEPVLWTPSASTRTQRASPQPRLSKSPDPSSRNCPSPNKLKEKAVILPCRQTHSESKVLKSTSRKGRESTRVSPSPRLTSSLPRPARPSTPPQPEKQRPSTPLVLQKVQNQSSHQQGPDNKLNQNWTKSQFAFKLRQTATAGSKSNHEMQCVPERLVGSVSARPIQCITPVLQHNTNKNNVITHQPPTISIQEADDNGNARRSPDFIRTFCPSKGSMGVVSGKTHTRSLTPTGKGHLAGYSDHSARITPSPFGQDKKQYLNLPAQSVQISSKSNSKDTDIHPSGRVSNMDACSGEKEIDNRYLFTPPPITPSQEAVLYQSLEEEILSNLQQLSMDSDTSDSDNDQYNTRLATPLTTQEISHEIQNPSIPPSTSASTPNDAKETRFEAVIGELSNGKKSLEKVSLESWVYNNSRGFRGKKDINHTDTHSSHLDISKHSVASSWSSLGSSMESKDSVEPSKVPEANATVETDLASSNSSNSGTFKQEKSRNSSFRQKRSLKKPERVPSIYKMKLKLCIHPRRDHRPDKRPSKIPKPVSYRGNQYPGEATQSKVPKDRLNSPRRASTQRHHRKKFQTASKSSPTASTCDIKCQGTDQQPVIDQELETWV